MLILFLHTYADHRDLHSFPTRRSSDLWLKKPSDFRATTKMPNFRLNDDQIKAISAFIWQSALTDSLPKHKRSEEHTSELQSHHDLVCRLLLEKKKKL